MKRNLCSSHPWPIHQQWSIFLMLWLLVYVLNIFSFVFYFLLVSLPLSSREDFLKHSEDFTGVEGLLLIVESLFSALFFCSKHSGHVGPTLLDMKMSSQEESPLNWPVNVPAIKVQCRHENIWKFLCNVLYTTLQQFEFYYYSKAV